MRSGCRHAAIQTNSVIASESEAIQTVRGCHLISQGATAETEYAACDPKRAFLRWIAPLALAMTGRVMIFTSSTSSQ